MKHLALVPLIGGMAIGAERALGVPPEAVLSYSAFNGNDQFYMKYLSQRGIEIPRYIINEEETPIFSDVDVVTSVCPCAGLSSATTRKPGQTPASCQQNEWMKISTRHILRTANPRVLIGENAPNLATNAGRPVAQELRDIGAEFGYSMQLVKTSTRLHGIPQDRTRSFFLLHRDNGPFEIEWSHNEYEGTWIDYLNSFQSQPDELDLKPSEWHLELWSLAKRIKQMEDLELAAFSQENKKSSLAICLDDNRGISDEYVNKHIEEEGTTRYKVARMISRSKSKIEQGRNLWDTSVSFGTRKNYPAVMWKTLEANWRPDHMRPLGLKEQMRLMGLPEDFEIPRANPNAICQNVPTCTAEWIVREAVAALNGERKQWDGEGSQDGILRQNNINMKHFK